MNNNTYEEDTSWAYAQCPDVDECGLGLHDCHKEAKCTNTQGSYSCQCKRGFIGDGKHSCTRTYVSIIFFNKYITNILIQLNM